MSVFGIICETNPIHNGHKHLITSAREKGATAVVCIMSGNTVQRGEFAIVDKYIRAEALLRCGADLVLELPFPWSSSSAEYFAVAAVSVLRCFCDKIIFGSECGNIELLRKAAEYSADSSFKNEYNLLLSEGKPAAGLYFDMLKQRVGIEFNSNDLLGVEYIKAARIMRCNIEFITVKRLGDSYISSEISDASFPSAMSVRKIWTEGNINNMEKYMPSEAVEVYKSAIIKDGIIDTSKLDTVLLTFFRSHNGSDFENIVGASGGLGNRICEMAHKARNAAELLELVKTKRYTDSSIRRTMMNCLFGVEKQQVESIPKETLLLSANKKGRELLSANRKKDVIKVVTKPADLDRTLPQNIFMYKIDAIYTLLRNENLPSDTYVRKSPYII